jgi:hypothetical protein
MQILPFFAFLLQLRLASAWFKAHVHNGFLESMVLLCLEHALIPTVDTRGQHQVPGVGVRIGCELLEQGAGSRRIWIRPAFLLT